MKVVRVVLPALLCAACATGGVRSAAPSSDSGARLRTTIDSMMSLPQFRNAHFGVLVVDPERGDTLYSRNAGKLFLPASNMKIVTGATSLVQLGPDFTFRTDFAAGGPIDHDTLRGPLIVTGRGDPSISDHMRGAALTPLRALADSLRAHAVLAIQGGLRTGADVFPDTTIGFGWSWDDLGEDYGAGVDALYFNEGSGQVIAHGQPGRRPESIETIPARSYPRVTIDRPRADIAPPDTTPLHLDFDSLRTRFLARGRLKGASDTITVVYPSQRDAYLSALREALQGGGIFVGGGTFEHHASDPQGPSLFTVQSPPLRLILPALEKPSQNQIAEILYKTLGLERTGVGSADSGRVVIERQLLAWGAAPDGFLIRDGSGLSRYDYLSPETIVRVLDHVRADSAFHVFYDALPIAGVDGSLRRRMRGTAAEGKVHAKTGSLSNARSLSGYVITADGHTLIFSLLANNWTTTETAVDSVQNAIAVHLAELRLRGDR